MGEGRGEMGEGRRDGCGKERWVREGEIGE